MVRIGRQFSLRALAVLVTVLCVAFALAARIRHFQQLASFHAEEAAAYERPRMGIPELGFDTAIHDYHSSLAAEYSKAVFRPWRIVHEDPPPDPVTRAKHATETWNLLYLRNQLAIYRAQHGGKFPTGDAESVIGQLVGRTNYDGSRSGTPTLGPYIQEIPPNPSAEGDRQRLIKIVTSKPEKADSNFAWIYDTSSGDIWSATDVGK